MHSENLKLTILFICVLLW